MTTGISIAKNIGNCLKACESITDIVGDKIFPIVLPEKIENDKNFKMPFIIFGRQNIKPVYTKMGLCSETVNFYVIVVSDKYSQSVELAEKVRECFELKRTAFFREITLDNVDEDFQYDAYVQVLTFSATLIKE